jgi:hypothetical protein
VTGLTRIKLLLAVAGVCVWGLGVRLQDDRITWLGVALLASAFLLRFAGRRDPR